MRAWMPTLVTAFVGVATPALAAGRQDTSGLFVWAFLGFCALIVAAQVVPAVLMVLGAARGAARAARHEKAPVEVKVRQ